MSERKASMGDMLYRGDVIKFIRNNISLDTFMKRTVAKADEACWDLCDKLNFVPTIDIEERLNDAYVHGWSDAEAKFHDAVEVVRCWDCRWYDPPHILHNDGTRTDVEDDAPMVTADVGINCGGQCIWHIGLKTYCLNHDREDPEDTANIVMFRKPHDYCSYGERKD